MKYSTARQGRVFIIRLEDGDILHECIEAFAKKMKIRAAALIAIGGADKSSRLVTGPARSRARKIVPMETILPDAHEITGAGTLFPDSKGNPVLHMHIACGRKKSTITGCVRRGVKAWHVIEIIIWELTGSRAARMPDPATGFELLQP